MDAPVLKANVRARVITLPRRSLTPGTMVRAYAVFGRKPLRGRTLTAVRCQSTFASPSDGESSMTAPRSLPVRGRSLTTLLNVTVTFLLRTLVAPESGVTLRMIGAVWSSGPVSYTHLRAHETRHDLVCRLLLENK